MDGRMDGWMDGCTYTCTHTHAHIHIHTLTNTCTHIYTHSHSVISENKPHNGSVTAFSLYQYCKHSQYIHNITQTQVNTLQKGPEGGCDSHPTQDIAHTKAH